MSQAGNLSSWAGLNDTPASPDFLYGLSNERFETIQNLVMQFDKTAKIESMRALRDYDGGEDTHLFKDYGHEGVYKVDIASDHGDTAILVMVKKNSDERIIEFGSSIFHDLMKQGVSTAEYLVTDDLGFHASRNGHRAYFTDYVAGDHGDASHDVMNAFGGQIGKMTLALQNLSNKKNSYIKKNSVPRFETWKNGIEFVNESKNVSEYFTFLSNILNDYDLDMNAPHMQSQHINLIEANTIYSVDDNNHITARILDCDTMHRGWGNCYHDLATYAWRAGLNMMDRDTKQQPEITKDILDPLRIGFNKAVEGSGLELSKEAFAKIVVQTAALKVIQPLAAKKTGVIHGIAAEKVGELSGHVEKMNKMFPRVREYARVWNLG